VADQQVSDPIRWWLCPNQPRCPHPAVIHDVKNVEDATPRCCADGCQCGASGAPSDPPRMAVEPGSRLIGSAGHPRATWGQSGPTGAVFTEPDMEH
jgi:hypothetical protein